MVRGIHPAVIKALQTSELERHATLTFNTSQPNVTSSSGRAYFTKIGNPSELEQYVGEAESLKAMYIAAPGLVPELVAFGTIDESTAESPSDVGRPYFITEYKDLSSLTDVAAKSLGKRLATELHQYKSTQGFGFGVPTYCGRTRQANGWYPTWEECYSSLIGGLLDQLEGKGRYDELCRKGQLIRQRVIPALLGKLVIQPVLLHGDLWSGNTGTDRKTGQPIIFDPSSYFGHNEADLAIGRIFGGIPKSFFTEYHQHLPKSEPEGEYELRGDLYELYHYLNHTVLFGGSYAASAQAKMNTLLKAIPAK
ncbi:Ketosamine-3-kinase [Panus rudis PR-1116 ss-1]|nr:Ketosamine-3-kinase [Panus rudis PR-1116 ss-1]